MKNYEKIYEEIYNIVEDEEDKHKKNRKYKYIFLIILFFILIIFSIIFFLKNKKKIYVEEKYFKTDIKEIDCNFKKYINKRKKELKNEKGNIIEKSIFISPECIECGKLMFLKYNIKYINGENIEEEIKIFPILKEEKKYLLNIEDIFKEEEKEKIYIELSKRLEEFKANLNESNRKYILDIDIKKMEELINSKNVLKTKQWYIDGSGIYVYIKNNIKYNKKENLEIEKLNLKLFIKNDILFNFLNKDFQSTYLKEIEKYNLKIQAEKIALDKKREEEKEAEKQKRKESLKGKKYIALTFDDGPGEYTEEFLDKLREKNVKTTFFLLGMKIPGKEKVVKKMYDDGHDIGNHSYNHPQFRFMKKEDALKNIAYADDEIKKATGGFVPKYLRPPYGERNIKVERESGKETILWNYDPEDWKYRDKNKVIEDIMKMPENSIGVFHDIHKTTVDGVIEAIDKKRAEGFEFVTISELYAK